MNRRDREIKDINEIERIIRDAKVLHLGLADDNIPYVVPMNYGYELEEEKLTLYLHSSRKGYKLDVIEKNPMCCFEIECDVAPFSGGDKPCQNGMIYSSVIGFGKAEIIEGAEEREKAMNYLMDTQVGKTFEFTEKMLSAVTMIKIDVSSYTAKERPHPLDREKKTKGGKND